MPGRGPSRLHGYLLIDKPAGWTSHDVVARVRRLTGERAVGHAGTLDPAATGLLAVAVGSATRTLEFMSELSKTYVAEVSFGVRTDSYDFDGTVLSSEQVIEIDRDELAAVLGKFLGVQRQVPPMHSAIKVEGKRLYELARDGKSVEREPRKIVIYEANLVLWQAPVATICVDCSKGTYIRSIAHDLGERFGCGAYLSNLVRTRNGPFLLEDAWTLTELTQMDLEAEWPSIALHPDAALEALRAVIIDAKEVADWMNGKALPAPAGDPESVRVYDEHGQWLGIARRSHAGHTWQPHKVVGVAA
jgi:tRNA pseudouridine55 synthase